jgi:hypothetical protein
MRVAFCVMSVVQPGWLEWNKGLNYPVTACEQMQRLLFDHLVTTTNMLLLRLSRLHYCCSFLAVSVSV